jgi:hypothetical protein
VALARRSRVSLPRHWFRENEIKRALTWTVLRTTRTNRVCASEDGWAGLSVERLVRLTSHEGLSFMNIYEYLRGRFFWEEKEHVHVLYIMHGKRRRHI